MKQSQENPNAYRSIDSVTNRRPALFFWIFPIILSLLIASVLAWMILSETDVVSPTRAKIIATKGLHMVQPKETSEIASVPVKEGDYVNKGDLLAVFEKRELDIELKALLEEVESAKAEVFRLQSLLHFIDPNTHSPEYPNDLPEHRIKIQKNHLKNQIAAHTSELQTLDIRIKSAEQEMAYLKAEIRKLKKIIPLTKKRIKRLKPLVQEGLTPRDDYERFVEDLTVREEDLNIKRTEIDKLKTRIDYNIREKELIKNNFKMEISRQLLESFGRLEEVERRHSKTLESVRLKSIFAPIDGIVHNLRYYTVGTVVQSGEVMMEILPTDTPLRVEANVLNRDIGFVQEGQKVKFKIDSFPFTKYGYIEGRIKKIERASVKDEQLGDVYPTIVELTSHYIEIDNDRIRLLPGMTGVVDIKTGKRHLIEYIIAPFLRYKDEALKER